MVEAQEGSAFSLRVPTTRPLEARVVVNVSASATSGVVEVADLVFANPLAGGLPLGPERGSADHGIGVGGSRDSTELGSSWSRRPKEHRTCLLMSFAAAASPVSVPAVTPINTETHPTRR